ncbi:MAG: hypothetical protein KME45_18050 [Stenomitos rutilans HA7619-LM2]|jgi:hypothetical protein|nr:hypothetical protein [Stenomitos rutilans HA7619-LM2]
MGKSGAAARLGLGVQGTTINVATHADVAHATNHLTALIPATVLLKLSYSVSSTGTEYWSQQVISHSLLKTVPIASGFAC